MCTKSSFCSAEILPSVLSADFAHLGDQLQMIRETGVKKIHFDIMDGIFVPSIALGFPVLASTRKATDLYLDVHLMVQDPGRYVEEAARCGADSIIHVETCTHLHRTIYQIRDLGKDACVVLNPATDLSSLNYILKDVNTVLLMTVNPGFGGQKFIENTVEKVRELRELITQTGSKALIEVDDVQKLARIKQNGPSYHIYPGSVHTRLSHSIGVYHLGRQILLSLSKKSEDLPFTEKGMMSFLVACLLHDIGHFPYAHSLN